MGVAPSFPFDDELRRIALAQALRGLDPTHAMCWVDRLFAYATAGLCPVDENDDAEALRRHLLRPESPAARAIPVPARNA